MPQIEEIEGYARMFHAKMDKDGNIISVEIHVW